MDRLEHRRSEHKPKHSCASQTIPSGSHHREDRTISYRKQEHSSLQVHSLLLEQHKREHKQELHRLHRQQDRKQQELHKREHMLQRVHMQQQELHMQEHIRCQHQHQHSWQQELHIQEHNHCQRQHQRSWRQEPHIQEQLHCQHQHSWRRELHIQEHIHCRYRTAMQELHSCWRSSCTHLEHRNRSMVA